MYLPTKLHSVTSKNTRITMFHFPCHIHVGAPLQGLLPHTELLTQRRQHIMQIFLVHKAISILIYHIKSFLKFLYLSLIKHRKHIGGGALRTFLGGSAATGCLSRCHFLFLQ